MRLAALEIAEPPLFVATHRYRARSIALATPAIASPDYYFLLFGDSKGLQNWFKYANPKLDAAIAGSTSKSAATRSRSILQAQQIFMDNLVVYPVAWIGNDYAHSRSIHIPFAHTGNGLVYWRDLKPV